MSVADRLTTTAVNLLKKYGSTGLLTVPTGPGVLDIPTGDMITPSEDYPLLYSPMSLITDPLSDHGLSAFLNTKVTFYFDVIGVVVNETCVITDFNNDKWGLKNLKTIKVNNKVVVYEADVEKL